MMLFLMRKNALLALALALAACQVSNSVDHGDKIAELNDTVGLKRSQALEWFNARAESRFLVRGRLSLRDSWRGSFGLLSACDAPSFEALMQDELGSLEEDRESDARAAEAMREILRSGRLGWLLEVDNLLNAEIEKQIGESNLVESCAIFQVERSAVPIEITSTGVIGRVSILEAFPASE